MRSARLLAPTLVCASLLALAGCGPSLADAREAGTGHDGLAPPASATPAPTPAPATAPTAAPAAPTATAGSSRDAPEISRSAGNADGLLVFWPRVIPRSSDPKLEAIARQLQGQLVKVAQAATPARARDVRPMPERVCPRTGCEAPSVGALLLHSGGGCAALALVAGPGKPNTRIVPWGGAVTLKSQTVGFRDYPENQVTIRDMVPCDQLLSALAARNAEVEAAVRNTAR
jgi:hypothetical protein